MLPIHRDLGFGHVMWPIVFAAFTGVMPWVGSFAIMFSLRANAISPRSALSQFCCAAGVIDFEQFLNMTALQESDTLVAVGLTGRRLPGANLSRIFRRILCVAGASGLMKYFLLL